MGVESLVKSGINMENRLQNKTEHGGYTCDPVTHQVEAGGSEAQGHHWLHDEFKANWDYRKLSKPTNQQERKQIPESNLETAQAGAV